MTLSNDEGWLLELDFLLSRSCKTLLSPSKHKTGLPVKSV